MHETIGQLFVPFLGLERDEYGITNVKDNSVVVVNAIRIATVMNAMMTRRV